MKCPNGCNKQLTFNELQSHFIGSMTAPEPDDDTDESN